MAEVKSREQLEAEWWEDWWRADYTWDGLAKKPLQGWVVADGYLREAESGRIYGQADPETAAPVQGQDANLQDYWRADVETGRLRSDEEMGDELVSATGQPLFHRIHLPLLYQNGLQTAKASWEGNALDALIASRTTCARAQSLEEPLPVFLGSFDGPDGRLRIDGAVITSERIPQAGAFACYYNAAFITNADFNEVEFLGPALFAGSLFTGHVRFDGASFTVGADFRGTLFLGGGGFR